VLWKLDTLEINQKTIKYLGDLFFILVGNQNDLEADWIYI
jgi:hypothetical protein